jgi:hypothetical protein
MKLCIAFNMMKMNSQEAAINTLGVKEAMEKEQNSLLLKALEECP